MSVKGQEHNGGGRLQRAAAAGGSPAPRCLKPYSHTALMSRDGRGCHGDQALLQAPEWCSLLFSVSSCGEEVSVAVVFRADLGPGAELEAECPSGSREAMVSAAGLCGRVSR